MPASSYGTARSAQLGRPATPQHQPQQRQQRSAVGRLLGGLASLLTYALVAALLLGGLPAVVNHFCVLFEQQQCTQLYSQRFAGRQLVDIPAVQRGWQHLSTTLHDLHAFATNPEQLEQVLLDGFQQPEGVAEAEPSWPEPAADEQQEEGAAEVELPWPEPATEGQQEGQQEEPAEDLVIDTLILELLPEPPAAQPPAAPRKPRVRAPEPQPIKFVDQCPGWAQLLAHVTIGNCQQGKVWYSGPAIKLAGRFLTHQQLCAEAVQAGALPLLQQFQRSAPRPAAGPAAPATLQCVALVELRLGSACYHPQDDWSAVLARLHRPVPSSKLLQPAVLQPVEEEAGPAAEPAEPEQEAAQEEVVQQQQQEEQEEAARARATPEAPKAWGALAILDAGFVVALAAAGIALWHQGPHWVAAAAQPDPSQEGDQLAAALAAEAAEQEQLEAAAAELEAAQAAGLAAIPEGEEEEGLHEGEGQRRAAGTPARLVAALAGVASRIMSPVQKPPKSVAVLSAEGESEEPALGEEEGPAPGAARWGPPGAFGSRLPRAAAECRARPGLGAPAPGADPAPHLTAQARQGRQEPRAGGGAQPGARHRRQALAPLHSRLGGGGRGGGDARHLGRDRQRPQVQHPPRQPGGRSAAGRCRGARGDQRGAARHALHPVQGSVRGPAGVAPARGALPRAG
jgi:hypothetical protein